MLIFKMFSFVVLIVFVIVLGFVLIYWIPKKVKEKEETEIRRKQQEELEPLLREAMEEMESWDLKEKENETFRN